jgi:O-antigen/teichoic acid export membrane protein
MSLITPLVNARQYLRLQHFDTSTEEGRSKERQRRALLTMIADVFARGCGLLVLILTLRISLPYLGQERYGILATIISFASILIALDLGIGNALIGQVAKTTVADRDEIARLVSRAFWVLTLVGATITVLLLLLSQLAPISWAFKGASPGSLQECRSTLALFAVLFGASIPLGAMRNVYHGLQRGYVVHLVSASLTVVSLALLFLLTRFHAGMPAFLFVGYGTQVLAGLILLVPFLVQGRITGPRREYLIGEETRKLLRVGGLFFLLQIGTMAGWGADPLILSSCIGPLAVVVFTLADRAAQLIAVPLFIVNKPLWAAYAEALARGDKAYIRKTLKRSLLVTALIATSIAMALFFGSTTIFRFLSKSVVVVPRGFLAVYLLWAVIRSLGDCLAMYMNGVHVLRPQVILVVMFIAVSIPAKIIFAQTSSLAGFVVASILSYLLASIIPAFTIFRKDMFAAITM